MSDLDRTLSAYVEGILPADEATALEARLEAEPELAEAVRELRAVLGADERLELLPLEVPESITEWLVETTRDPDAWDDLLDVGSDLLEPVEPPAALTEWVRERAAEAAAAMAVERDAESAERDVLASPDGERLELLPVEVPPALETWLRDRLEPAKVKPFPRRELWVWRIAAALLGAIALGLFLSASGPGRSARVAELESELREAREGLTHNESKAREAAQQLVARTVDLGRRERELASAQGRGDDLTRQLRRQGQDLGSVRQSLAAERRQVAALQTKLQQARPGDVRRALAKAQAAAKRERARADRSGADLARVRSDLKQARESLARRDTPPSQTVAVAAAYAVERWDVQRGWVRLQGRDTMQPGDVVRGVHIRSRIRLGRRDQRLGAGVFVVRASGLQPLPAVEQGRGRLPRAPRRLDAEPKPPATGILTTVGFTR